MTVTRSTGGRRSIVIAGYYGFGNLGDEAILAAMLDALKARIPEARFTVVSGDPAATARDHDVLALSWSDPQAQSQAIAASDAVLLGGGGLFHDYWGFDPDSILTDRPTGMAHYAGPAFLAAAHEKPLMLYAVGVGPLLSEAGRRLTASIAQVATRMTVRDRRSALLLEELGVPGASVVPDPAFGLAAGQAPARRRRGPVLGVALRPWDVGVLPERWEAEVAAALDVYLEREGARVVFLPFQTAPGEKENDVAVAERVRARLRRGDASEIRLPHSPAQASAEIAGLDAVLAMRLHAGILAAAAGVPLLCLRYDPKISGLREWLPPGAVDEIDLAGLRSEDLVEGLRAIESDGDRRGEALRRAVPAIRESARATADVAAAMLDSSDPLPGPIPSGFRQLTASFVRGRLGRGSAAAAAASVPLPFASGPSADPGEPQTLPVEPQDVVVLSIVDWAFRFQRPQQIAAQFGRHGHRVFYLHVSSWLPPGGPAWELTGRAPGVAELTIASERALDLFQGELLSSDVSALAEIFTSFARENGVRHAVCLVQTPFWAPLARRLRDTLGWTTVYDCMDDWATFPGWGNPVLWQEKQLVSEADLTVVSADRLAEKWRPRARRLALVRNGVDLAHYQARFGPSRLLRDASRPVLGYFGALAAWVDVPLLEKIARAFPEATLVLAGGVFDIDLSRLEALPNVRLLGQQPYAEMPALLSHFDVCLIPFVVNEVTEATNPVKFYEYAFGGAPVVAPDLPELRPFEGLCHLSRDHDGFLEGIRRSLAETADDPRRLARRRVAAENDWSQRYLAMIAAIREAEKETWALVPRAGLAAARAAAQAAAQAAVQAEREERAKLAAEVARLSAEGDRLSDALAKERRATEEADARRGAEQGRAEAAEAAWTRAEAGRIEAWNEVTKIQTSRLWKAANLYWSLRRGLGTLAGAPSRREEASRETSGGTDAALLARAREGIAESNRHDVLCLPIIAWDFRRQRPQHLMSAFARAGHRVFYLSPEFRQSGPPFRLAEKEPRVFEVSLCGEPRDLYKDRLDDAAAERLLAALDDLRREAGLGATALMVQLPFWGPLARRLADRWGGPLVYDLMDFHAGFSSNTDAMVSEERKVLESADLVLASSDALETHARRHSRNVLTLKNACDAAHFAAAAEAHNARPVVGYYGAISDWFDVGMVVELARKRPDWDFVLVGSTWGADVAPLQRLANVKMPGERPYAEMPRWLGGFDVAVIPFLRTPLTEATNPVKAYEILAAGKPLVAVPLPELTAMAPLVRLASTAAEFEREISAALGERGDADAREARRAYGRAHTWESRFASLAPAVAAAFRKASIVVVTFHNRDLNRLCLESLYARTEWPHFEVLVVDNGSTDGTVEMLREAEARFPNLRVLANLDNRGFAAANNQGLSLASGEILVLLNNDTVASRGWLSRLISHLTADPAIGLVGPSTNAIANEQKVEVSYSEVEEMPAWAQRFVREHDGETLELPMIAMFCVAMRRQVFERIGPLDERFVGGMFEDDDYCRRIRDAGYAIRVARDSFLHHWQRASFRLLGEEEYKRLFEENRRRFEEKWGAWVRPAGSAAAPKGRLAAQLSEVVRRAASRRGAVVFLPSIGWDIHLFQRPHHLARAFARRGWVAVFDCSNANDDVDGFLEIEPNLFLYRGPEGVLSRIPGALLWAFPYNFEGRDGYAAGSPVIYDWIDDLDVFPHARGELERGHARGLAEATVVASVARRLHEQALAVRPDAIYLPNGVEFERFSRAAAPAEDPALAPLLSRGAPIAGYYGALARWFDYALLDGVAEARPDWSFLLIGPNHDGSAKGKRLFRRENVLWIGPRDYETLPGYLARFDVATIPFAINPITTATSPLKLFEYFAGGRPVVTTPMPECAAFPEVRVAADAASFGEALEEARRAGADAAFRDRLVELGRENSWDARIDAVIEALERRASKAAATRAG